MLSGCSEEDDDVVHKLDKIVETYAADPEKKRALFRKLGIEDHAAGSRTPSGKQGDASQERRTLSGM